MDALRTTCVFSVFAEWDGLRGSSVAIVTGVGGEAINGREILRRGPTSRAARVVLVEGGTNGA